MTSPVTMSSISSRPSALTFLFPAVAWSNRQSARVAVTLPLSHCSPTVASPSRRAPARFLMAAVSTDQPPPAPTVSFVYYDGSSFVLEYSAPSQERPVRLLVDPWLVEDLVFLQSPSFFRGRKQLTSKPLTAFGTFDALLLTQHLPDHAHPPTLARLPRDLPVFAPYEAAPLLQSLGYHNCTFLDHFQSLVPLPHTLPQLTLTVGPGALVGPPWAKRQLAFLFEFHHDPTPPFTPAVQNQSSDPTSRITTLRIYHETHGDHDLNFLHKITDNGRIAIDTVIGPVCASTIPALFNYRIVNGVPELLDLCRRTRPKTCVAFDNTKTESSGLLSALVDQRGPGIMELATALRTDPALQSVRLCIPEPMETVVITGAAPVVPGVGAAP